MSQPKASTGIDFTPTNDSKTYDFTPTIHNKPYDFISPLKHDLKGISVLITGASRGIGEEITISFARAGASKIALAARSSLSSVTSKVRTAAQEAGRPEPQILSLQLDVTDHDSISQARSTFQESFGNNLDVLVSNAGYLEKWGPLLETDLSELSMSWDTNLRSHVYMTQAFLPLLRSSALKTIVGISSTGAHTANLGFPAYQTSKLAMLRFMEFVCEENADVGVLGFSVHPGGVKTKITEKLPEELRHLLVDEPELAGDTIAWLVSERRMWLGGRYVSVTWDMEELEGMREEIVEKDLLKVKLRVE